MSLPQLNLVRVHKEIKNPSCLQIFPFRSQKISNFFFSKLNILVAIEFLQAANGSITRTRQLIVQLAKFQGGRESHKHTAQGNTVPCTPPRVRIGRLTTLRKTAPLLITQPPFP